MVTGPPMAICSPIAPRRCFVFSAVTLPPSQVSNVPNFLISPSNDTSTVMSFWRTDAVPKASDAITHLLLCWDFLGHEVLDDFDHDFLAERAHAHGADRA